MEHEIVTLTFFKEWHELTKKYNITYEQYGRIMSAMCEYCFYGTETKLETPLEGVIFDMAKPYIRKSSENKINGQRGGAPKGNQNAKKK